MTSLEAIILGCIQGLTEFLPVSSSGHLALAQYLMKLPEVSVAFDVLLHLATLVAVIVVLRSPLQALLTTTLHAILNRKWQQFPPTLKLLVIGSIPAGIFGIILNDYMGTIFSSVRYFSIGFLITGILLSLAERVPKGTKSLSNMTTKDSLTIGLFQAVAIMPSISRSGSTIAGSLLLRFKPEDAFLFSFLLSIPAILGAGALHADELLHIESELLLPYILGFFAAMLTGYMALLIFKKALIARKLKLFSYYCLMLSLLIFFFV